MRYLLGLAIGCLLALPAAVGQVTVEVEFEGAQFISGESLEALVRIVNFSGQTLKLGDRPDWLTFSLETEQGAVVSKHGDVPVLEAFTLPSSGRATRRADLAPYFDLTRPGRYRVQAIVKIPQLEQEVLSPPAAVNIATGAKLWEQEVGLPVPSGADPATREVRKYALIQALRQKIVRLFVRVTDAQENRIFKVACLGPLVSFSRPEAQVDARGRLHVLFQTGPQSFSYIQVGPEGELALRQTHQYVKDSRPTLRPDAEGVVGVAGGVRVPKSSDLPPPEAAPPGPPAPEAKPEVPRASNPNADSGPNSKP